MSNWTEADLADWRARQMAANTRHADFALTPPPRRNRHPEVALQIAIVAALRPLLAPGARLLGCNGELAGGQEMKRAAAKRKAMGYMAGTPDMLACQRGFVGWIECKVPPNKPTPEQAEFARWAIEAGYGWAVVTSVPDAHGLLRAWGMLRS